MSTTFIEAFGLLAREGLEAILVLAALAAYLSRIGADDRVRALWAGAGFAVLVSVAGAWVFERYYGGGHNDIVEGVIVLAAAGVMFWVSGWLFLKQDPRAWQAYLKTHTDRAVGSGTVAAVALLAFLAVAREGAETILFVHALAQTAGGWTPALLAGLATASVALAVVFGIIRQSTRRLPLRAMFIVTSAFLFLMGLRFVGEGLQEFQEQALIPFDPMPGSAVLETLGLNPTWEAVAAQVGVMAAAALSMLWIRARSSASKPSGA